MVAPVAVAPAGLSLFLDVCELAAGGDLAILAEDAAACERCEAEKPNETDHGRPLSSKL